MVDVIKCLFFGHDLKDFNFNFSGGLLLAVPFCKRCLKILDLNRVSELYDTMLNSAMTVKDEDIKKYVVVDDVTRDSSSVKNTTLDNDDHHII